MVEPVEIQDQRITLKLSDYGFWFTAIGTWTYLMAYFTKYIKYQYWHIPEEYIGLNFNDLIKTGAALITLLFILIVISEIMFLLPDAFFEKNSNMNYTFAVTLSALVIFVAFVIVNLNFTKLKAQVYLCIIGVVISLIWKIGNKVITSKMIKMDGQISYGLTHGFYKLIRRKIGFAAVSIMFLMLPVSIVLLLNGYYSQKSPGMISVIKSNPEMLVIDNSGGILICKKFNRDENTFDQTFEVLKDQDWSGFVIEVEQLGQLSYRRNFGKYGPGK